MAVKHPDEYKYTVYIVLFAQHDGKILYYMITVIHGGFVRGRYIAR